MQLVITYEFPYNKMLFLTTQLLLAALSVDLFKTKKNSHEHASLCFHAITWHTACLCRDRAHPDIRSPPSTTHGVKSKIDFELNHDPKNQNLIESQAAEKILIHAASVSTKPPQLLHQATSNVLQGEYCDALVVLPHVCETWIKPRLIKHMNARP